MTHILKVGLDIHGVIDTFPKKFSLLSRALWKDGAEVHIVTGSKRTPAIDALLKNSGIYFTHYFSIVEYLEQSNVDVEWRLDLPFADDYAWNIAKSQYCDKHKIDLMLDDSPIYLETFHDIDTTYLHVINKDQKVQKTR